MNARFAISLMALAIGTTLMAQDLKPVKDKETKLFGYQNKAKEWVIKPAFDKAGKFDLGVAIVTVDGLEGVIDAEGNYLFEPQFGNIPAFDNDGLSVVMVKENRQKFHGVISTTGKVILPTDCLSAKIDSKRKVICAERIFEVEDPQLYNEPTAAAWGVYDLDGGEIFAPSFADRPSFSNDGTASVKDKGSRLCGVISADGRVLLPLEYHYAYKTSTGFRALDQQMRIMDISEDATKSAVSTSGISAPWMPIPYNCGGDMVKAFAYGHRMIGRKVYKNSVWLANAQIDEARKRAQIMTDSPLCTNGSPIEWDRYYSDFLRLELAADEEHGTFINDKSGVKYTVCLNHYTAGGELIGAVSNWGAIIGDSLQGVLYEGEGKNLYFISHDINWPDERMAVNLERYSPVDPTLLVDELGLDMNIVKTMGEYWASKTIIDDVDLAEKAGYQSYIPYEGPGRLSEAAKFIASLESKYPFLTKKFYAEHVYSIVKMSNSNETTTAAVAPGYVARYKDDYGNSFRLSIDEPVFWGVRHDRFLRIMLVPFEATTSDKEHPEKASGMINDPDGKSFGVRFAFGLFEDDGTFVRMIGGADRLDIIGDEVIGFSGAGLLFSRKRPERGEIKFRPAPFTGRVSDFKAVNY